MHTSLRRRLLRLYRPPRLLPSCCYGLWHQLIHRFARLRVILQVEGDGAQLCRKVLSLRPLGSVGQLYGSLRPHQLEQLLSSDVVKRVWLDREVHLCLEEENLTGGAVRPPRGASGRGVTIAIVDTGIFPHPDLRARIIGWIDLVRFRRRPYDDHGHGTLSAGAAAGDGYSSRGRFRGMAPGAFLVGVKVLNRLGTGRLSTLLEGIDWVIRYRHRFAIRVLSLGAQSAEQPDDPLAIALERAWQAGVVVVTDGKRERPSPVIAIGALDGPSGQPDLLVPQVRIASLRAPGSWSDRKQPSARLGQWHAAQSSATVAAPMVAGVAALLLEREPGLAPDGVKARLMATATDWGVQSTE